jgi:hypothetical protein
MARDKNLLDGVVKYIQAEGWVDALQERLRAHTLPAIEERGLEEKELARLLDQQVYALMFTCVVEDLMSRAGADGRNVTDAYIKRHGWKLGSTARRQLEGVRDSRMELYEIDAVSAGVGMTLRNLLAEGDEKVLVEAEALSRALPMGCTLGARVLRVEGKMSLTGGILPFDEGMAAEAAAAVGGVEDRAAGITIFWLRKTLEEQLGKVERPGALPLDPTGDKSPDPIHEEVEIDAEDAPPD